MSTNQEFEEETKPFSNYSNFSIETILQREVNIYDYW